MSYRDRSAGSIATLAAIGFIVVVIGVFVLVGFAGSFSSTDGGTISVIRNGGPFDTQDVRQVDGHPQVLQPGSAITQTGWYSTEHPYFASQRIFTVSAAPSADSNEVISVPSKDGVQVGIEGSFRFNLNPDPAVLADFDNKYGTRTYPYQAPQESDGSWPAVVQKHAWDGDEGWTAFLNAQFGTLVSNSLREKVGDYTCVELLPSCVYIQNTTGKDLTTAITDATNAGGAATKIDKIQTDVQTAFASDVETQLGNKYFEGITFTLSKVTLGPDQSKAIDTAQSAGALVAQAVARKQAADIDAQANISKQNGYNSCASCQHQDENKSLPSGLTSYTYAPGGAVAVR